MTYELIEQEFSKLPYYQRSEIKENHRQESVDTVSFTIWLDLAPDLKLADTDGSVIRIDYEFSDECAQDYTPAEIAGMMWHQLASDVTNGIKGNNKAPIPNFEVTGVVHPDFAGVKND